MNRTPGKHLIFKLAVLFSLIISINVAFSQTFSITPESDSLFIAPLTYEYIPDATYAQIEKRLASIKTEIPLTFNNNVKSFVDYFTVKDREHTKMALRRSTYYFPIFEEIFEKYGLPDELKYLAIVESGLNPTARSWAAAVGLWQFVYLTGRSYGLHSDWYVDERMDPIKSTEAAAKYMKSLYNMFGDWELALAAYNCGPGNVRKAIRRSGYKKKFWEIFRYLPRETRGYLPQFVAITYAFNYAEEHNLILDESEYLYAMESDTIMVRDFLNLTALGNILDVCEEDMHKLNPSIKQKALPQNSAYFSVRLPSDKMDQFNENRTSILDSASKTGKKELEYLARNSVGSTYGRDKVIHRVRSGDVLGRIAQTYHVRVSDIKKWNNLNSNTIRVGQRLNIWLTPQAYTASVPKKKQPVKQNIVVSGIKYHIVQPGDTLWDISRAYSDITIEKLKKLNNLKSNKIQPGQKLVVG